MEMPKFIQNSIKNMEYYGEIIFAKLIYHKPDDLPPGGLCILIDVRGLTLEVSSSEKIKIK